MAQATIRHVRPALMLRCDRPSHNTVAHRRSLLARAEDGNKVVREYQEGSDSVKVPGKKEGSKANPDGTFYIDEVAEVKKEDPMSKEMKSKLRDEYVAWGGAPNKPLSTNPFLVIILIISAAAVAAKITGALDTFGY